MKVEELSRDRETKHIIKIPKVTSNQNRLLNMSVINM